jgi:hypothetical protein
MPDNRMSYLKGIVRRTIKMPVNLSKNGMGVELIEKDKVYIDYVKTLYEERGLEPKDVKNEATEFKVINCKKCGINNKVKVEKLGLNPICGRCGASLF